MFNLFFKFKTHCMTSRTQQILDQADKLLETNWSDDDRVLINRMISNLKAYKSFIPNSLKDDIRSIFEISNKIKKEYDELFIKFTEAEKYILEQDLKEQDLKEQDLKEQDLKEELKIIKTDTDY